MKTNSRAYNFGMQTVSRAVAQMSGLKVTGMLCALALLSTMVRLIVAQDRAVDEAVITTKQLPPAGLWNYYSIQLEANSSPTGHTWKLVKGVLPRNLELRESGRLVGVINEQGTFAIRVIAQGQDGARSKPKDLSIEVEAPLKADWLRKSHVSGNRIDGSIKVSNTTGRDFDLTFDVLAVNEAGRATAIGYQHFTLKKNTRDMELPFGDTLPPGSYVVNVDVVAEEPQSKMIFRSRMVAPKQTIAPVL